MTRKHELRVAELFAGVGGFRRGLASSGWRVVWSNQWEPSTDAQHASDCYVQRFGPNGHTCADIARVIKEVKSGGNDIPDHELLVGGFPCQDYSVAKPLPQATGIRGKKGALWWSIYDVLAIKRPPFVLLENVDRLLKSPAGQRGRDFAVILACLAQLGYVAEWRVVNAADYGFPQRRRRVFLCAHRLDYCGYQWQPVRRMFESGVFARSLRVSGAGVSGRFETQGAAPEQPSFEMDLDPYVVSERFGAGLQRSPFRNAGVMMECRVWTEDVKPVWTGRRRTLGDVVRQTAEVPEHFYVPADKVERWTYLKSAKSEKRVHKATGFEYRYSEGGMTFPDPLDRPARTILTGEGGTTPSRFKHVISDPSTGRLRRLTPEELEELNGFPRGWTDTGMSDGRRAFMMGNALVVGIVERVGHAIKEEAERCLSEGRPSDVSEEARPPS